MTDDIETGSSFPLGAAAAEDGVNFSVFSKNASKVELLFFDSADAGRPSRVVALDRQQHRTYHYWHVFVPRAKPGQIYAYRVLGPLDPGRGLRFDPQKVLLDPYGRAVSVPAGYDRNAASRPGDNAARAMKSVVAAPSGYNWEGDRPLRHPYARTVIYEMHLAGFTRHPSSGVAARKRGTYAGLIEKIPYCQDNEISWFDWSLVEKHAGLRRFVKLVLACRLDSRRDTTDGGLTLTEFLSHTRLQWHGVRVNSPDWGPQSRSLAVTVRGPRLKAVLHLMLNAYWEPLEFELPPTPPECEGPWRRWVDTYLEAPEDISEWLYGSPVTTAHYTLQPRSLVVLIVHETQDIAATAD